MGTHPNAILLLELKHQGLPKKEHEAILTDLAKDNIDDYIKIGDQSYHIKFMLDDYYESMQITANEGSTILVGMITYGYGERIAWDNVVRAQLALAEWAKPICEKHHCVAEFFITANYW